MKMGGLGLRDVEGLRLSAWTAAALGVRPHCRLLVPHYDAECYIDIDANPYSDAIERCRELLPDYVLPTDDDAPVPPHLQKLLQSRLDDGIVKVPHVPRRLVGEHTVVV